LNRPADPGPGGETEVPAVPVALISDFFVTLGKALRAFQLYDENNPVYQRFVHALSDAFAGLWEELDELQVSVEEDRLAVGGAEVYQNATRSESLAFLLYKDGLRSLTFRPGIESEARTFLELLTRARMGRGDGEDLVTLLWEEDLRFLRYRHVDLLAEGLTLPEPGEGSTQADLKEVLEAERAEAEEALEEGTTAAEEATPPQALSPEEFNPTLYALDAREMTELQAAIEAEMERDVRGDVVNALFDRLEEPRRDRQAEILDVLSHLVPALLSRGELETATRVLSQLHGVAAMERVLGPGEQQEITRLVDRLSAPDTLGELVRALEDRVISPAPGLLAEFLGQLRSGALATLIRAAETTHARDMAPVLHEAVEGIARKNRQALLRFVGAEDPVVAAGAVRLAARLELREAAPQLPELFYHDDPGVRRAAVEAVLELQATTLGSELLDILLDPDAGVRVAAARVLGAFRFTNAAPRLKEILQSREIRSADLSEQIAMFEAYGSTGDRRAVQFLNRYLNGKGFLGRREPAEIRACAALALGKVATPEAREALRRAAADDDPVVRNAVGRGLRGGRESLP
jgi:hypothetical protein